MLNTSLVQIVLYSAYTNTNMVCSNVATPPSYVWKLIHARTHFTPVSRKKIDSDLRGFTGGFLHNSKAYFVPSYNGRGAGAKVVRVDASNFSSSSVEVTTTAAAPQSGIEGLLVGGIDLILVITHPAA